MRRPAAALSAVTVAALGVLLWTGGVEVLDPPAALTLQGRERAEAEAASGDHGFWDGGLARSIETRFRLRGRVRRQWAPLWSLAMLRLGDVPGSDVVVGRDGWLFLRERVEMSAAAAAEGEVILSNLYAALRRSLRAHGTELVVMPLPRKAAVCAEQLPVGLDPTAAIDASVLARFRGVGLATVDVMADWQSMECTDVYQRLDSHWALPARAAAVRAVARTIPDLPLGGVTAEHRMEPGAIRADTLGFAGVPRNHWVAPWAGAEPEPVVALVPNDLVEAFDGQRVPVSLLVVGSSFCANRGVRELLVSELGLAVADASQDGRLPLVALAAALEAWEGPLPPWVLSEFPMHQVGLVKRTSGAVMSAATAAFEFANRDLPVVPVGAERIGAAVVRPKKLNEPIWGYRAGSLLSSGDGVLSVEFEVTGDAPSTWYVASGGARFPLEAPAGSKRWVLPITEAADPLGNFSITPTNEGALTSSFEARIVTDVDLGAVQPLPGERPTGSRRWTSGAGFEAHAFDALVLEWTDACADPFVLVVTGATATGEPAELRWSLRRKGPRRFAIFGLGPLEGGRVDEVRVEGAGAGLGVSVASRLER